MVNPFQEAKNFIDRSKNIYILPSQEREESITSALALFYTLKELGKNVNLVIDEIPEKFKFLIPSLNYISYPRNFVIAVPKALAEVSQIHYEKDEKDLKIHLTLDKGNIRKNDISFCFTEPKADLLITVGLNELGNVVSESHILSDAPVININNNQKETNFGKINLQKPSYPLAGLTINFIKSINTDLIKDNVATALLTGLIIFSDNFRNANTSPEILENAAHLIKSGAPHQEILKNIYNNQTS